MESKAVPPTGGRVTNSAMRESLSADMAVVYPMLGYRCAAAISGQESDHVNRRVHWPAIVSIGEFSRAVIGYIARDISITGSFGASR